LADFKEESKTIQTIEDELRNLTATIKQRATQLKPWKEMFLEHRRPADELSAECGGYWVADELTFEGCWKRYRICGTAPLPQI